VEAMELRWSICKGYLCKLGEVLSRQYWVARMTELRHGS